MTAAVRDAGRSGMAGDVDDVVVVSDIMLGVTAEDGRVEAVGADEVRVAAVAGVAPCRSQGFGGEAIA